jgi:ribosome modulation factor
MLEILAAYLFIKCYVAFDASRVSFWGYDARLSGRSTEQCVTEFKTDVERFRASTVGQRWLGYWGRTKTAVVSSFDQQRLQQAASLTSQDLDRLLAQVRENIRVAKASGK